MHTCKHIRIKRDPPVPAYFTFCLFLCTESEADPAQVFISYQWDAQDEVNSLRDRLEKAGFSCWMDIGQMGGGDQLYAKIDEAIRGCKVSAGQPSC